MQNRYAGDIGDYVKFALLRALERERCIGVAWWLSPDEDHNGDGRHLDYLDRPLEWRKFDPPLFDALKNLVARGDRGVRALERAKLLKSARFASAHVPSRDVKPQDRERRRKIWFAGVVEQLQGSDLVFVDPDNGLEPAGYRARSVRAIKSVRFDELRELAGDGRTLLVYHHQTHRKGGNLEELQFLQGKLRQCTGCRVGGALRASAWSPRAFFLLNPRDKDVDCLRDFALRWQPHCQWYPATEN